MILGPGFGFRVSGFGFRVSGFGLGKTKRDREKEEERKTERVRGTEDL
jgi:hypothetical protein